jgi:hypothetical protein
MRTSTSIPRMYADDRGLKHGELTNRLIGIFFDIYNELGHGSWNQSMSRPSP